MVWAQYDSCVATTCPFLAHMTCCVATTCPFLAHMKAALLSTLVWSHCFDPRNLSQGDVTSTDSLLKQQDDVFLFNEPTAIVKDDIRKAMKSA